MIVSLTEYLIRNQLVFLNGDSQWIEIGYQGIMDPCILGQIRYLSEKNVKSRLLSSEEFEKHWHQLRENHLLNLKPEELTLTPKINNHDNILNSIDKPKIVQWIDSVFLDAIKHRATDIHFSHQQDDLSIKYRVDGMLFEVKKTPSQWRDAVILRLKVLAGIDIMETRRPQDGRFKIDLDDKTYDIRCSTYPTQHGEQIVLRLLKSADEIIPMDMIGMTFSQQKKFKDALNKTSGMIIVCGATGSGKTTTLYSALNEINHKQRHVMTIEDPIEYQLADISQSQINLKIGMDFSDYLRSTLRQDPDVILVGEIRDSKTAQTAIRAAQTGHLVLTTIHTISAVSCISRLLDLGIEKYLIASSLNLIIAQKLYRKICSYCRSPKGCSHCFDSGYLGRSAIFEMLNFDNQIRQMIQQDFDEIKLKKLLHVDPSEDMSLQMKALIKDHITTEAEAIRIDQEFDNDI